MKKPSSKFGEDEQIAHPFDFFAKVTRAYT
jgi:hypothetical protein